MNIVIKNIAFLAMLLSFASTRAEIYVNPDPSFHILPIQSVNKKDAAIKRFQLKQALISKQAKVIDNHWVALNLSRRPKATLKEKLQIAFEETNANFVIFMNFKEGDTFKFYDLSVFDRNRKKIFEKSYKLASNKSVSFNNYQVWAAEIMTLIPDSATVYKKGGDDLELILSGQNKFKDNPQSYLGRYFQVVTNFKENKVLAQGVVTAYRNNKLIGQIYNYTKNFNNQIQRGSKVVFLKNKSSEPSKDIEITSRTLRYENPFKLSMRACTLLPIVGAGLQNELFFNEVQEMMKNSSKCTYKNNSGMISILKKYKNRRAHLSNPQVLSTFARRLQAGALFRVDYRKSLNGMMLKLDVVSENGTDIYYHNSKFLSFADINLAVQIIESWLDDYAETIPYTARVVEIIDDKLLLDLPKDLKEDFGEHFNIYRPTTFKQKRIQNKSYISWDKTIIGQGSFSKVDSNFATARVRNLENKQNRIQKGDWIQLAGETILDGESDYLYNKHNSKADRPIARIELGIDLMQLSATKSNETEPIISSALNVELYLPYRVLAIFNAKRNLSGDDNFSSAGSQFDVGLGMSFAPHSSYLVSVFDLYLGYRWNQFDFSNLNIFGVGEVNYRGPYLGLRGQIPLYQRFLIELGGTISPFDSSSNSLPILGEGVEASSFSGFIEARYQFDNGFGLFALFDYRQYNAQYQLDDIELNFTTAVTQLGLSIEIE